MSATGKSRTAPPWRTPGPADAYRPSLTGPRRIPLSGRATQEVFDQTDPTDEEAYLLLGTDGMLREEAYLYRYLDNALQVAMKENLIIVYLKEPGKAYRVTWLDDQLPRRNEDNYELEVVLLEPDLSGLDEDDLANNKKMRSIFKGIKNG